MTTINDVIHIESKPAHYKTIYPFSATIHVPGEFSLTLSELAKLQEAIVNVASELRRQRGHGECNFAWCEGNKIDWKSEGFSND